MERHSKCTRRVTKRLLLLLDCCHGGSANTNESIGVTEVISSCPYNSNANGVGPYSFTHALVLELEVNEPLLDENNTRNPSGTSSTLDKGENHEDESISSSRGEIRTMKEVPRLALAIRFNENLRLEDLPTDIFIE